MTTTREWLTTGEVAQLLGICPSTLRRWVQQGTFPQPSRLSQRVVRWPRQAVEKWMNQRQGLN